ncbi:MAG: hypothetical protein ACPGQL_10190 [Thermoplasmatota archaeon]
MEPLRSLAACLLAAALLVPAAVASPDIQVQDPSQWLDPLLDPADGRTLYKGGASNLLMPATYQVIGDQATLDLFYKAWVGSSAPHIDFGSEAVLVASTGYQSAYCGFGFTGIGQVPLATSDVYAAKVFGAVLGNLICYQVIHNTVHVVAVERHGATGAIAATFHDARTLAPVAAGAAAARS